MDVLSKIKAITGAKWFRSLEEGATKKQRDQSLQEPVTQ